jgi:hypothetical protein
LKDILPPLSSGGNWCKLSMACGDAGDAVLTITILSNKTFGGSDTDYAYDLVVAADGGYVSGNHGAYDAWVLNVPF